MLMISPNIGVQMIYPNAFFNASERGLEQGVTPYLNLTWWMGHPVVAVAMLLILLVIAQAILGLMSYAIKQLLLWLVKSPYRFWQWAWQRSARSVYPTAAVSKPQASLGRQMRGSQSEIPTRLLEVVAQLETTQREQNRLLQELKTMIAHQQPIGIHPDPVLSCPPQTSNPKSSQSDRNSQTR